MPGHGDYVDQVQIALVQHLPVIGEGPIGAVLGLGLLEPRRVDIGGGDQVQPGRGGDHAEVVPGVTAAADHGGVQDAVIAHWAISLVTDGGSELVYFIMWILNFAGIS